MPTPAHLHLLLNHLPIIGLGVAALSLFLAILSRNRGAQIIALSLIILTSASAWPVYATGEKAYKTIRGLTDDAGADWLDTHMERAEKTIAYFAVPPALALLAIFLPLKFPRTTTPLLLFALFSALACLGVATYIAEAGGKIRHAELRSPTPTPTP